MPNPSQVQCLPPTWCPPSGSLLYPVGKFVFLLPSLGHSWDYGEPLLFLNSPIPKKEEKVEFSFSLNHCRPRFPEWTEPPPSNLTP